MVALSLVWITAFALGVLTYELCKAWYGRPPPFAVPATLAFVVVASLAAAAFLKPNLPFASVKVVLLFALCSGVFGCYGADLALDFNLKFKFKSLAEPLLAPATVWPSDLHVESISPTPSAPAPPTLVCPYVRL